MEIEYKWDMPGKSMGDEIVTKLGNIIVDEDIVHMRASYFDTTKGDVRDMHGGLRIREENDARVCCLKLAAKSDGGCKLRREFEVELDTPDIAEGLRKLPGVGAPQDVCDLLIAGKPVVICETVFERHAYKIVQEEFEAELALDFGELSREGRIGPIHEMEFEHLAGSHEAFHVFARDLQERFMLQPQPLSKLARAMAL